VPIPHLALGKGKLKLPVLRRLLGAHAGLVGLFVFQRNLGRERARPTTASRMRKPSAEIIAATAM
jgi:hypothetical protein